MDLWIRSQDGTMISKFDSIRTAGPSIHVYIGNYHFLLGNYKTEERALEVLDEIERLVTDLQYMSNIIPNDFYGYQSNVYQMPKE